MLQLFLDLLNDDNFKEKVSHKTLKYEQNSHILREGSSHSNLYLIKSGLVRISVKGALNDSYTVHPGINELGPDDIFGEFSWIDGEPANADVIALADTELLVIDGESLINYLDENPAVGYKVTKALLKTLVHRLRKADKSIVHLYLWGLKGHSIDKYL